MPESRTAGRRPQRIRRAGYHRLTGWSTFEATIRAQVKTVSGQEIEVADQVRALATHQVTIRPLSGLTTRMRFVDVDDTTQVFNVLAIDRQDLRGIFQYVVQVRQEV
jgi:head-tail adaptor